MRRTHQLKALQVAIKETDGMEKQAIPKFLRKRKQPKLRNSGSISFSNISNFNPSEVANMATAQGGGVSLGIRNSSQNVTDAIMDALKRNNTPVTPEMLEQAGIPKTIDILERRIPKGANPSGYTLWDIIRAPFVLADAGASKLGRYLGDQILGRSAMSANPNPVLVKTLIEAAKNDPYSVVKGVDNPDFLFGGMPRMNFATNRVIIPQGFTDNAGVVSHELNHGKIPRTASGRKNLERSIQQTVKRNIETAQLPSTSRNFIDMLARRNKFDRQALFYQLPEELRASIGGADDVLRYGGTVGEALRAGSGLGTYILPGLFQYGLRGLGLAGAGWLAYPYITDAWETWQEHRRKEKAIERYTELARNGYVDWIRPDGTIVHGSVANPIHGRHFSAGSYLDTLADPYAYYTDRNGNRRSVYIGGRFYRPDSMNILPHDLEITPELKDVYGTAYRDTAKKQRASGKELDYDAMHRAAAEAVLKWISPEEVAKRKKAGWKY